MKSDELKRIISIADFGSERPAITVVDDVALRCGRTHEVTGAGADMFALMVAAGQGQDIVWIGLGRDVRSLCPTGLAPFVDVERVLIVEAVSRGELLWAADQALRAEGGFCVIVDLPDALSLKESRRLQVAAEQGGGIGLLLLRGPVHNSAAQTRWSCMPVCGEVPSWDWTCLKGKNGESGAWRLTFQGGQYATDTLHMAAPASA